ncbi:MAG: dihydrolipoamide acetyltransferase family protein [Spirochaetota bacterium]
MLYHFNFFAFCEDFQSSPDAAEGRDGNYNVILPQLTETMEKATIMKWYKKAGDYVEKNEKLYEVETDKMTIAVDAIDSGYLCEIKVNEGEEASVGAMLAVLSDTKEKEEGTKPSPGRQPPADTYGEALARNTEKDSLSWEAGNDILPTETVIKGKRKPLPGYQKMIAERVTASHKAIPVVHFTVQIDMLEASALKERGILYDAIFIFSASRVLKDFPLLYSHIEEDFIFEPERINIAFAVGAGEMLLTPVIQSADKKNLEEIALEVKALVEKSKNRTLKIPEMTGGNFLISNLGMYPIESFTAIIYPGQSSSLAVGTITPTPAVHNNQVIVKSLLRATLSVDHRLINGRSAAEFLTGFKNCIESISTGSYK